MKKALLLLMAIVFGQFAISQVHSEMKNENSKHIESHFAEEFMKGMNLSESSGIGCGTLSDPYQFETLGGYGFNAVALDDTRFFVSFKTYNDTAPGTYVCIGTYDGTDFSFTQPVKYVVEKLTLSLSALSADKVLIAHKYPWPIKGIPSLIATVSPTDQISFGTPNILGDTLSVHHPSVSKLTDSTFVMGFRNNSFPGTSQSAVLGKVEGTTVSFGKVYNTGSDVNYNNFTIALSENRFAMVFEENDYDDMIATAVGTVINDSISFIPTAILANSEVENNKFHGFAMDENTLVISYHTDYETDLVWTVAADVSGNAITYGDPNLAHDTDDRDTYDITQTKVADGRFVVGYQLGNNIRPGIYYVGEINGTNVSLGSICEFLPTIGSNTASLSLYENNAIFLADVPDDDDNYTGYVVAADVNPLPPEPIANTESVNRVTHMAANANGQVRSAGNSPVSDRGFCFSTDPMPTIADDTVRAGTGTGNYEARISGLDALTKYYVRAYATNNSGTAYGDTISLTTLKEPTFWTGPDTTIVKLDNADWTLPENQDRLTDSAWITRANSQGIFNIALETQYDKNTNLSPLNTQWATGTIDNYTNLDFKTWREWAKDELGSVPNMVDVDAVLKLVDENINISIKFTSWTQWDGGGFSYIRSKPPPPVITITSPENGAMIFDDPATVSGITQYPLGTITLVEVSLNGGSWQSTTGTENWEIALSLPQGPNTIVARASDENGPLDDGTDTVYCTKPEIFEQAISITQGWSLISSYLQPAYPALESVFESLETNNSIIIVASPEGIYWPSQYLNTIGNWNVNSAYKVKMEEADQMIVTGAQLPDNSITYPAGFNYIAVHSNQSALIADVFTNPEVDIVVINDLAGGRVYWPEGGLYTLTDLEPGVGYQALFNNELTLEYPPYSGVKNVTVTQQQQMANAGPWEYASTGSFHTLSVTHESIKHLEDISHIGAFDTEGSCIGFCEITQLNQNTLLRVFGDDETTSLKDGALAEEFISYRAYNRVNDEELILTANYNAEFPNHDGVFVQSGLSSITSFKAGQTGFSEGFLSSQIHIYPNPAQNELNLVLDSFDASHQTHMELVNAQGSVLTEKDIFQNHSKINISKLPAGMHILKITQNGKQIFRKVVIQ